MKNVVVFSVIFSFLAVTGVLADPVPASICDCQAYNGVAPGDIVTVEGVCTVETGRMGYSITVLSEYGGGAGCSIVIFDLDEILFVERGQCARITGELNEYYDRTEIVVDHTYPQEVWDCNELPPEPIRLGLNPNWEELENCIIIAEGVTVLTEPDAFGNITIRDRYDNEFKLLLSVAWPIPDVGTEYCAIIGMLDYHFGEYKLRPLDLDSFDDRPLNDCPWMGTSCDPMVILSDVSHVYPQCILPGEEFRLSYRIENPCVARMGRLYMVMEISFEYWFWPAWTQEPNYETRLFPELDSVYINVLQFEWPPAVDPISIRFYTGVQDPASLIWIGEPMAVDICSE